MTVLKTRRVIRLLADRKPAREIAQRVGISQASVYTVATHQGPAIATVRRALVANADAEHILSRDEVLRIHTLVGLTAIERDPEARHPDSHRSLAEIAKIQSYYEAPKVAQQSSQRDKSALALASSPLFREFLSQEAAILKAGKIIEMDTGDAPDAPTAPAIPRPSISAEDRERQEAEDREFAALMGDETADYIPDAPSPEGSSKRAATVTLYDPTPDDLR